MSPAVAVTFSLPSVVAGDNDAPGLCTVQLLNTLSQLHADAMNQLHAGGSPLLPRAAAAADAAVPTISHNTPYEVMRRQLLSFDPAVHLMPRLVALRRDAADEAAGGSAFDLAALERSLVASVLAVATPLQIHIHHFAYAGELQRSGQLGRLRQRVPQRPLGEATLEAIWAEVDTQQRAQALLALLEQAIAFLGALGGGGGGGGAAAEGGTEGGDGDAGTAWAQANAPLEGYARRALLLSADEWEAVSTPTLAQQVCLCHLQSLFVALDEGAPGGSVLDAVSARYREALPPDLEAALGADALRVGELLPVLHDLMSSQLVEARWPADASLKQYLAFSSDADLEEAEWFVQGFPEALELRHALSTYLLLQKREGV